MWWLSLLKGMHDQGQQRRDREQAATASNAPAEDDATGLSGGVNANAAFGGDVGRDQMGRARRREAFGQMGRGIAQRYLRMGGE